MNLQVELKEYAYKSNLKSRALSVLIYLIDRINKERTCFPSLATICKKLHISLSTVKRAMKELFEKGFLKREARFSDKKNGGQTSNLYTVSTPTEHQLFEEAKNFTETENIETIEVQEEPQNDIAPIVEQVATSPVPTVSKPQTQEIKVVTFQTLFEGKAVSKKISDTFDKFVQTTKKAYWKEE